MVSTNLTLLNELLSQIYTKSTKFTRNHQTNKLNSRSNSRCRCSISSCDSSKSNLNDVNDVTGLIYSSSNWHDSACGLIDLYYRQLGE